MSPAAEMAGAAIVCDARGVVVRVVYDRIGITGRCAEGTAVAAVFDRASQRKAAEFIRAIHQDGAAFNWQLCVVLGGEITLLHGMGFSDKKQIWIVLARTEVAAALALEEMSAIQNEQATMVRAALKYASQTARSSKDESHFEDMTRLYNDLGTMQRELAQRNVELEALRAKLEAKHAELIAANARLDALATMDGLTGIANRRAFQARLEAECARCNRQGSALALILLDVDHFKSLNDHHGHQAGDDVLQRLGRVMASTSRSTDLVARYGGEEFAVVLADTDRAGSWEVAEKLRRRIEEEPWPYRAVTVSVGIACWGPGAVTASELIAEADRALYFSKKHGRNCVTHCLDMCAEAA